MALTEQVFQDDNGGRHTKPCKFISVEIKVGNLLHPQSSTPSWLVKEVEFSFQVLSEQSLSFFFLLNTRSLSYLYTSVSGEPTSGIVFHKCNTLILFCECQSTGAGLMYLTYSLMGNTVYSWRWYFGAVMC